MNVKLVWEKKAAAAVILAALLYSFEIGEQENVFFSPFIPSQMQKKIAI